MYTFRLSILVYISINTIVYLSELKCWFILLISLIQYDRVYLAIWIL